MAEKGVIPCYKPIQAKDEKGKGRVPKMYDRDELRQVTDEQSIKLWRRRYTGCIILKNGIRAKAVLHNMISWNQFKKDKIKIGSIKTQNWKKSYC